MTVEVSPFWAYITFIIIIGYAVLIFLLVKSSNEFTQADTLKAADDFAGVIKDSHGPVTTFLWVCYIALIIWSLIYLYLNWHQFEVLLSIV